MSLRAVFFRFLVWTLLGFALSQILVRIFLGASEGVAYAAPADPYDPHCRPGEMIQHDMMGVYESRFMYVEIFPCAGAYVLWMNDWGEHEAGYLAERRSPTGGYLMGGYIPDPEIGAYLDAAPYISVTPAESGFVKVTTLTDEGNVIRIYRLQKTR